MFQGVTTCIPDLVMTLLMLSTSDTVAAHKSARSALEDTLNNRGDVHSLGHLIR